MDSTSPQYGEKASYYSAVCLETGEVEWMELEGNSNFGTSVAFLEQLSWRHGGRLNAIWDNAPAHREEALRSYLKTPGLNLRLVNLPGYSPDLNADEAIWGWAREEATGNLCLGSRAAVQDRVGKFWLGYPAGKTRRDGAAERSYNEGPKHSCETRCLIPIIRQMHVSLWLWFSYRASATSSSRRSLLIRSGWRLFISHETSRPGLP